MLPRAIIATSQHPIAILRIPNSLRVTSANLTLFQRPSAEMQGSEVVAGPASVRQARISSANPRLRRRERQIFWVVIVGLAALIAFPWY
jgi:hypothetical protein